MEKEKKDTKAHYSTGDLYTLHNSRIFRWIAFFLFLYLYSFGQLFAQNKRTSASASPKTFIVGVAGDAPFVTKHGDALEGIAVEVWQSLASDLDIRDSLVFFTDVPTALEAMEAGKLQAVTGPVSITSDRAVQMQFSQPYFYSGNSILSRTEEPTMWERVQPFFTKKFFAAAFIFICILGIVGTLFWLVERERNQEQFPRLPAKGIANGMWCAIVTMSTTGYGDKAPVTFWGRLIAGIWMVISIIFATTMVAGIASTLTLTGMNTSVISNLDQLAGKRVAVVKDSPADDLTEDYGGKIVGIQTLKEGYDLLKEKKVDAVVFDRPELLYYFKKHPDEEVAVSRESFGRGGYGIALPLNNKIMHQLDIELLKLNESGRLSQIIDSWLGKKHSE